MRTSRFHVCALLLLVVACGDERPYVGGGEASGGSATSGGGPASGGGATGGAAATGGQGGGPTQCRPLKNADDPTPTDGVCDGDKAITCDQDGALVVETCATGWSCRTYPLIEYRWDPKSAVWLDGRAGIIWAACLPDGASTCPTPWTGEWFETTEFPHCDGADQIRCTKKPAPDLHNNGVSLELGSDEGYQLAEPCDAGLKCAGNGSLDFLTCIDAATPSCDPNDPAWNNTAHCVPDSAAVTYCQPDGQSQPGYVVTTACDVGDICYPGTVFDFCAPPGKIPCDEATTPWTCTPDGQGIHLCDNGYEATQDCLTACNEAACRCADLVWGYADYQTCAEEMRAQCVGASLVACDPALNADSCVGDVAHRCKGVWTDIDCGAEGLECGVNQGIAGCRAAGAPPNDLVQVRCEGDVLVDRCECGQGDCVPGYERRVDCATAFPFPATCQEMGFFAGCF